MFFCRSQQVDKQINYRQGELIFFLALDFQSIFIK